jgi:GTP-binding protein
MNTNAFVYEASYGTAAQLPPSTLPEIAFAGRSNVGKSSLLNCLLRRKGLARVSGTPGKTVTVNFYTDGSVRLADLPGYGYAKRPQGELKRFADLMEGYFKSGRGIALVVQLIDMRHPPTQDDRTMLDFLREMGLPFAVALTKRDKLRPMQYARRMEEIEGEFAAYGGVTKIPFSSVTGEGRAELLAIIGKAGGG